MMIQVTNGKHQGVYVSKVADRRRTPFTLLHRIREMVRYDPKLMI